MPARLFTALAATATVIALSAGVAQAASFEGTVVAKNKDARTFAVTQDEGGGTFKFKVTDSTKYQRLAGFGAIKVGAKNIDVVAHKNAKGRWIATNVEVSGKSGGGGGGNGGGKDDGPNHT